MSTLVSRTNTLGSLYITAFPYFRLFSRDQINGDLAPANGDAYFIYGKALLQFAIQQNTVLGQSAQASAKEVEEQQEQAEKVESSNPLVQVGDMPDFTTKAEEESDEEEEEEEGEAGNADEDFETAWDILDVARVIFEKGEDKDTKLKLADVHLCLGDVSLETGNCLPKILWLLPIRR